MKPTKLALVIPNSIAPKWFHALLEELRSKGIESRVYTLFSSSIRRGYSVKHIWLHNLFGNSQVDYLEGKSLDSSVVSDDFELLKSLEIDSETHIVDFTNSEDVRIFSAQHSDVVLWKFSPLAWTPSDKDISYRCWSAQKAGSIIEYYRETNGVQTHLDSVVSPGGQISLFDYRCVYAAFPGRFVQWLQSKTLANSSLATFSDLESRGTCIGNTIIELSRKIVRRLRKSAWVLLYKKGDSSEWNVISAKAGKELADPFVHSSNGNTFVFAEEIDPSGLGRIVAFPLEDHTSRTLIIDKPFHMSYPYLIEEGGKLYMIPEASESNTLTLYRCTEYPYKWEKVCNLLEETRIVDASVIKWKGRWWMFGNTKKYGATYNEELSIFYADLLIGPWLPHNCNPICVDSRYSRPAGAFIVEEDQLFRYVQDCSWTYGERIHKMAIQVLTESKFSECWMKQVDFNLPKAFSANHTYNQSNNEDTIITDVYN